MNFEEITHFLFETYAGVGVLILAGLILSVLVCAIWERKTRKTYVDRGPAKDEWAIFSDEEDDEETQEK